jgi:ribosomal protein S18 acetylase RimI-like enzyme
MSAHVSAAMRPDGRLLLRAPEWTGEAATDAVQAAQSRAASAVTHVDERAVAEWEALTRAGFAVSRRDAHVAFEVERALEALHRSALPAGVLVRPADDVDEDALRHLDDELRHDVPGTAGWRSTPEEFCEHTFADPAFDPRTYLVAVDEASGDLLGLVRIWMNPQGPRLGNVGVRRPQRGRGIGSALLALALRAVEATGADEVTMEHDVANEASSSLADRLGARRIRTVLELVYEPASAHAREAAHAR